MKSIVMLGLLLLQDDLKTKLKDTAIAGTWHYDDLAAGIAEAKKADKPLLIVFR